MRGVLFITTDQYLLGDVSSIGLGPGEREGKSFYCIPYTAFLGPTWQSKPICQRLDGHLMDIHVWQLFKFELVAGDFNGHSLKCLLPASACTNVKYIYLLSSLISRNKSN